nr:hypothetical protein [Lachnospiraceae bacterium]
MKGIIKKQFKRAIALVLTAMLVISFSVPANYNSKALIDQPMVFSTKVKDDVKDKYIPSVKKIVEVGDPSDSGLIETRVVDENGNEVDLGKVKGKTHDEVLKDDLANKGLAVDSIPASYTSDIAETDIDKAIESEEAIEEELDEDVSSSDALSEEAKTSIDDGTLKTSSASYLSNLNLVSSTAATASADYDSSVKGQGQWGACWAFSAIASIENNVVKQCSEDATSFGKKYTSDSIDLSERHLAYFAHNSFSTKKADMCYGDGVKATTAKKGYAGGNISFVQAYAARYGGVALEEDFIFDETTNMKTLPEKDRYAAVVGVSDVYSIGEYDKDKLDASANDVLDTFKAYIMTYGATSASIYSTTSSFHVNSDGYECFYGTNIGTNHAITVVGWDDNFSKKNFGDSDASADALPAGDGAWLCKNSWGSGWSKGGYFYVSYYDESICNFGVYQATDIANSGRTYAYSGNGPDSYISCPTSANIYQCQGDETLTSVGLFTSASSAEYEIQVYVSDDKMTAPNASTSKGTLKPVSAAMITNSGIIGFHRYTLPTKVSLKAGQYFSIVVVSKSGNTAAETNQQTSKSKSGQTYYYVNNAWVDSNSTFFNKKNNIANNSCIYAYTTDTTDAENYGLVSSLLKVAKTVETTDGSIADEGTFAKLTKEIAYAETLTASSEASELKAAIRGLKAAMANVGNRNLYTDRFIKSKEVAELYLNGGSVKENGISVAYKTKTFYIDMVRAVHYYSGKKQVPKYKGKYVTVMTSTATKPTVDSAGVPSAGDSDAQGIVTAKVSSNRLKLTAKKEGDCYVWVFYVPTDSSKAKDQWDYAVTRVHVGTAPSAVTLADSKTVSEELGTYKNYTTANVCEGATISDIYVRGTVGSAKKANLSEVTTDSVTYTPVIPKKFKDWITVTNVVDSSDASSISNHFQITVKKGIRSQFNVKAAKKLTISIGFKCSKNAKKSTLKLLVGNPVTGLSYALTEAVNGVSLGDISSDASSDASSDSSSDASEDASDTSSDDLVTVTVGSSFTGTRFNLTETRTLFDSSAVCTDGFK